MRPTPIALILAALAVASEAIAAPPVLTHRCPNGLEVWVAENRSLPIVTIEIAAKNGSMTESPEFNGLSHLYEHMFFKANAVIPSQGEYLARMRELGMNFNGTTSTERVNYFFTTTTDHFKDAMVFMRDAIVTPKFVADELDRERKVVTGEMDRNEANPGYHFGTAITQRVFWKHPSRKDPLGNRKTVLTATVEKMRTIQKLYYVPNNSLLVVSGDVDAKAVFAMADALYVGWPKGEDPFKKNPLPVHPPIPKSEVIVVEQPVETVSLSFTWHGPSTVGPSVPLTYAADLLGTALGEASSKFQKALVDSRACVRASLSWYTQKNVGPITLSMEATPEKADACVKAAIQELPRMRDPGYVSDEDMRNAIRLLEMDKALERERTSSFAHTLTFWWASASLDYYNGYVDSMKKVTRADFARLLDEFVLKKPYVFGAMLSPAQAKQGLTKAHFEELLGLPPSAAKKGAAR